MVDESQPRFERLKFGFGGPRGFFETTKLVKESLLHGRFFCAGSGGNE